MRLKLALLVTENDLFNYLVSSLPNCLIIRLNNGNLGNGAYKAIRTFNDDTEIPKGVADCVVIYHGYTCFVEFKSSKGKLSKDQIKFRELCQILGIDYYTAYPHDLGTIITLIKNKEVEYVAK